MQLAALSFRFDLVELSDNSISREQVLFLKACVLLKFIMPCDMFLFLSLASLTIVFIFSLDVGDIDKYKPGLLKVPNTNDIIS